MLSFVMVFFCANAEKFAVDNLYYFISADGMSATVSFADDSDNFKNNYAWLSEVVIPETVEHDGKSFTVTAVGENAFRGCTMLEKVALPSTLERIGNLAFYKCSALTEIGVPASVTHIAGTAFGSCAGLESITVDAANIVYDSREDCNAVIETATGTLVAGCKNTVVPASVTAIGNDAFSGHSGLEVINLPPTLTSIGNGAFYSTSLSEIIIPDNVESIGLNAFRLCNKLTAVRLPVSLTTIGVAAFSNCGSLATVILNPCVTEIGDEAFSGDKKLIIIICAMPSPENIVYGFDIFNNVPITASQLFVPNNAVEDYGGISPWNEFPNISGLSSLAGFTDDGIINVSDVSALMKLILSGSTTRGDIDLNGLVNISDISKIYEYICDGDDKVITNGSGGNNRAPKR